MQEINWIETSNFVCCWFTLTVASTNGKAQLCPVIEKCSYLGRRQLLRLLLTRPLCLLEDLPSRGLLYGMFLVEVCAAAPSR